MRSPFNQISSVIPSRPNLATTTFFLLINVALYAFGIISNFGTATAIQVFFALAGTIIFPAIRVIVDRRGKRSVCMQSYELGKTDS